MAFVHLYNSKWDWKSFQSAYNSIVKYTSKIEQQHCGTPGSQSSLIQNLCQSLEIDQPPPVCENGKETSVSCSPIVPLPEAPEKFSHVTHLETKLLFPQNLLTYAKKSSRLYQLLPNSSTLFKIPNVSIPWRLLVFWTIWILEVTPFFCSYKTTTADSSQIVSPLMHISHLVTIYNEGFELHLLCF